MKRTTKILLTVCLTLFTTLAYAQLRVVNSEVNLGKVLWNTQTQGRITVENQGRLALKITNVYTDCGCLVADYPKTDIAPGARADVTVTFTAPLLGSFTKNVLIYAHNSEEPLPARLQGTVVSEMPEEEHKFSYQIDQLSLSADHINFTDVNIGDRPQQVIYVRNDGNTTYEPALMHLPKYLTATYEPQRIFRGRTGKITVTLNSSELPALGLTQASIYLSRFPGDKVNATNELTFSAVVHPALQNYTQTQLANAPIFEVSTTKLELDGRGKPKKKLSGKLMLTNKGKTPLSINHVQVFHPALNISLGKTTLTSGQSTPLDVSVLTQYLGQSKQPLRLLLITNDPKNPQIFIDVKIVRD